MAERIFEGRRALVAGATSGVGAALARRLTLAGAAVTAIGKPGSHSPACVSRFIELDLDEEACIPALTKEAKEADILCVVRGEFLQKLLDETSPSEWQKTVFSNLVMPGAAVSAALSSMKERRWGRILLFGGTRTEAVRGFLTNAVYAAAKTALSSIVRSCAEGYGKHGVSCVGVCPGFVDDERLLEEERLALKAKAAAAGLISAEKIAETGLYLLSNFYLNGCIVTADAAWTS